MDDLKRLPLNIINQILQYFVKQFDRNYGCNSSLVDPDLTPLFYKELLGLRLVSKTWSKAVVPFYFNKIHIDDSRDAKVFLDDWNDTLLGARGSLPVGGLCIKKLWYSEESTKDDDKDEGGEKEEDAEESIPVSMGQVSRLISLFGSDLKTLDITFVRSMGVSSDFIEAIKTMKDLRSLRISFNYKHSKSGTYDLSSISKLLSSIPKLENLTFHYDSLDNLELEPPALSNLRLFSFTYESETKGLSHIMKTSKDSLKIIELFSSTEDPEGLGEVFEPIKDTLEGLFTVCFCEQLYTDVTKLDFPKLRVLRTEDGADCFVGSIYWLEVPMLKHVRTLVTDLHFSEDYWEKALKDAGKDALKEVPNFKHIVFTRDRYLKREGKEINPALVEDFKSRGVQCHVMDEMTCDEIMELDYKLNGPMN
ncbi:uncharacterized protein MELLADRAFT_88213 [Melampsora larici-populina 98AG31]|uniref:F-box domain-containing protein n=1 Tax=Melampsora larici-populina (strain 98AG31 / pathotype 3-4-7) TaxID=747676 RepID=F4RQZ2_MELLP|nr:uncharacterized protein MELLADRAFT_88213 [Melampsora larici-populina 98AG31]EGG05123.1 hypothetical protein MELLADRAFT_88213 [Melampsora larici-populina 98AG31]